MPPGRDRAQDEPETAPIQRSAAAHLAVWQIREMVVTGTLRPGQALPPERELAGTLGVSRSTLREALRALELVNVLESRHGSGTFVTSLEPALLVEPINILFDTDSSTLLDLIDARLVIEPGITRLAAANVTDEELDEMDRLVERLPGLLDDPIEFSRVDLGIHDLIAKACRNALLIKIAESMHALAQEGRKHTTQIPEIRQHALEDHRHLAGCLRARDVQRSGAAMEEHLKAVKAFYARAIRDVDRDQSGR